MLFFNIFFIIWAISSLSLGENYFNFIETNDDKLVRSLVDKLSEYAHEDNEREATIKESTYIPKKTTIASVTWNKEEDLKQTLNENLSIQDELFLANLEQDGSQLEQTTPLPDIIEKLLTIPSVQTTQIEQKRHVEDVEQENNKGIIDIVKDLFDFNT